MLSAELQLLDRKSQGNSVESKGSDITKTNFNQTEQIFYTSLLIGVAKDLSSLYGF